MIFEISRVSDHGGRTDGKAPCEGAIKTGSKIIARDTFADTWAVEIKSLSELMELIDEVGSIVIDRDAILIYDDYLS